ncbi:hypothetical protein ONZ45_g2009 [Pleurotus djamor]|nr:hypothetical protein ONZ45_g2009 [Pleurotus djamor]
MVHFSPAFVFAITAASVHALPLTKRIAQSISASTAKWEQACLAAGGGQQCNPVSVNSFSTLLAAVGPCGQQDAADSMVDLAKTLGNDTEMIRLAQIFVQQPRNTPTSLSVQYCDKAPRNSELNGLFQCQFAGANPTTFVGGVAVGQPGTIPFALNAPVSPPGSCPASPNAAVPDGAQLSDIVQNPGVGIAGNGNGNGNNGGNNNNTPPPAVTSVSSAAPPAATTAPPASGNNGGFKLQNGQDAQALNAQFAGLSLQSPCEDGDQACVNGGFAQCVGGRFVIATCSAPLQCFALPLVNKPGTSLACTTESDAEARIAASGATGGLTGGAAAPNNGNNGNAAPAPAPSPAAPAPNNGNNASGDFKLQNGKDAQAQNAQFASLTAASACQDGQQACVEGAFAQCVNGRFVLTQCAGTLTCAALPLVNKPGTSITCTTQADAEARIAASGATGGFTGA